MKTLLLLISFISFTCNAHANYQWQADQNSETQYGDSIPIMLGIHNEHSNKESLKIEFINNSDKVILIHAGEFSEWGMRWIEKKVRTGEYLLRLSWEEETGKKKIERKILIKPEAIHFSLNIELTNDSGMGREHNGIYLDQYVGPLADVVFERKWNPNEQVKNDSILLPEYDVINNNDSIVYGAYTRFSSRLSINWVQAHYIAFMRFEKQTDSGWEPVSCNAPRIRMSVKSGEKGETLKDMVLGCPVEEFESGNTYRIRITYMLNDKIFEKNEEQNGIEDNVYVEQTIHTYTDVFKLEF